MFSRGVLNIAQIECGCWRKTAVNNLVTASDNGRDALDNRMLWRRLWFKKNSSRGTEELYAHSGKCRCAAAAAVNHTKN